MRRHLCPETLALALLVGPRRLDLRPGKLHLEKKICPSVSEKHIISQRWTVQDQETPRDRIWAEGCLGPSTSCGGWAPGKFLLSMSRQHPLCFEDAEQAGSGLEGDLSGGVYGAFPSGSSRLLARGTAAGCLPTCPHQLVGSPSDIRRGRSRAGFGPGAGRQTGSGSCAWWWSGCSRRPGRLGSGPC